MESSTEKILVYASVLVIVVSLASIGIEFTGYATDNARVNISVVSSEAINFTNDSLDFGWGRVTAGVYSLLQTNGSGLAFQGNWTVNTGNLTLQNIGNVNVSLNLTSSANAATFIGGSGPRFGFMASNNGGAGANACIGSAYNGTHDQFRDLNTSTDIQVCQVLDFSLGRDMIAIDIELRVPDNSNQGALSALLTATGTTV